jgi:hypothetical protein
MLKDKLKRVSAKSINYYIEKNLNDFYTKASTHSNFSSHREKKISWVQAKIADWPNCIFNSDFGNVSVVKEVNIIKKLIQEGKAPNGWTIGPLTTPTNLGSTLEEHGFSNVYHQAGMAIKLEDLTKEFVSENQLEVRIVDDTKKLRQWIEVVSTVFGIKIDFELLEYLYSEPEARFYIGNFKGKLVSALMLYLSSGVAGLHAVSTLGEYRSRGFGLVISKMALLDAYKMGFNVGVLQASALGERIYKKLGFKKFCDINSYELDIKGRN